MKQEAKVVPFPAAAKLRDPEELAFLPAALEIVETPPSPTGRATGATLIALFVLAVATRSPLRSNAASVIASAWPLSTICSVPDATSQIRTASTETVKRR